MFSDSSQLPYPLHAMILFISSILAGDIAVKVHVTDTEGEALQKISVAPVMSEGGAEITPENTDAEGYAEFSLSAGTYSFTVSDALGLY